MPAPLGAGAVMSINNAGVMVGCSSPSSATGWIRLGASGNKVPLSSVAAGMPSGFVPNQPEDINDFGWITGGGLISGQFYAFLMVPQISLDMDTNMNGEIYKNDDVNEMEPRCVVIDVNNDRDGLFVNDNLNEVIDGTNDFFDLTALVLRRVPSVALGGKITLNASDASKIRVFDDNNESVISPVKGASYNIPLEKITNQELRYSIEGIEAGEVFLTLTTYAPGNISIAQDQLRVYVNVDKLPGNTSEPIRNRICSMTR
ncbi:MAG: hypothetical protein HC901_00435 [Bdellovibrionaceae bacterium]|nr:hypothetical protein [Pseudobdellovibrionaceae bacterium]